jgi:uncharacterized membrane protein
MGDGEHHRRRGGLFGGLRASFLTGLIVVLPAGLTIYLIWTVVGWIDSWVLPFVPSGWQPDVLLRWLFGEAYSYDVRGIGVVLFLLFTVIVGWLAKGLIGRSLLRWGEGLVDRMPVVRSIYNGLKQIAETVFAQSETSFDRACLVEYPRKGIWAIGFVSTRARGEIADRIPRPDEILSVFLPTTPNPTSGFLLYVPAADLIMLEMKVEDAAKLIISAGLVYPNAKDPTQPPPTPH